MKKIIRDYAIIYIDDKGDSLKEDSYTTKEMVSDYYTENGFLQWNFYLIVPKEVLLPDNTIEKIENNEDYTRKFVIKNSDIQSFIKERFPVMNKKCGKIEMIKGNSWKETLDIVDKKKFKGTTVKPFRLCSYYPSWYRNESSMHSLIEMDKLRAKLINNPNIWVIFYTHINSEYYLAQKKFKLFLNK